MPSKTPFSLGDQNVGVFAEICEKNGIISCWLQWKFELAVLNNSTSPFTIDTNSDSWCNRLKDGVKKVAFTIDFNNNNPNVINYVRFTESHEGAEKKCYIVTQTSVDHAHEGTECKLWLELPSGTRNEDIRAVINLWKVKICCDKWKEFLPASPVTQLEKAHRVVALENVEWLKKQLMKREAVVARQDEELEQRKRDIDKLTVEISELRMQLADVEREREEVQSREVGSAAKRKTFTHKSRVQQTPQTTPMASSTCRAASDYKTTPKRIKLNIRKNMEDPFVGQSDFAIDD